MKEFWEILDEYWGEPAGSSDDGSGPAPAVPAPSDGPGSPEVAAEEAAGSSASVPEAATDSQPIEASLGYDFDFEDSQPVEEDSQPIQDDFIQEPEGEPAQESQQLDDSVNPYAFESSDDEGEETVTFGGDQRKVEVPVDKSPAFVTQKSPVFSSQSLTDVSQRRQHMAARLDAIKWGV